MSESMPWLRQVWHVFAKDVRRHWWMLVVFVVHAFAATMGLAIPDVSLEAGERVISTVFFLYLTLPVTAALLSAMVVLDDAPTESHAWWPTLALSRDAVFGAKLLFVLGLMPLIAVVATAAMHLSFDVPVRDLIPYAVQGTKRVFLTLVLALSLAALLRDLRGFILWAVLLFAGALFVIDSLSRTLFIALGNIGSRSSQLSTSAFQMVSVALMLLVLFATWRVYRTRLRSWTRWVALLALVLVQLGGAVADFPAGDPSRPERLRDIRVSAELRRNEAPTGVKDSYTWRVRVQGLSPELQAGIQIPVIALEGTGECKPVVSLAAPYSALQSPVLPIPGPSLRWRGREPRHAFAPDSVWIREWLPDSRLPANCIPVASVRVHVREPHLLSSIPLETGASFTRDGFRVIVRNTDRGPGDASGNVTPQRLATVEQSTSVPRNPVDLYRGRPLSYVLLHEQLREAIPLEAREIQYSRVGGPVTHDDLHLFLDDSTTVATESTSERRDIWQLHGFANEREFDSWLRGAKLVVFEWKLLGVIDAKAKSVDANVPGTGHDGGAP